MNVKTFTLAGIAAPLFIASVSNAEVTALRARLVDPTTQTGANGSWAANGYPTALIDTWRVYAVSNIADEILAVGDLFTGGNIMSITSGGLPTDIFFNAVGAFGNNGLQKPTDFTVIPGLPAIRLSGTRTSRSTG
jgi:hypothetical protein